jgi:aminoglycoside phosphotransferase (APT) family kinase protein
LSSPQALLASIPGWQGRRADIAPLPRGHNNRSYRVAWNDRLFVLRIVDHADRSGMRDFALESQIQHRAAALGIAAPVEYANPASGLLLTRYLPGTAWTPADLQDTAKLEQLAELLRALHALPLCGVLYDAVHAADAYLEAMPAPVANSAMAVRCREIIADAGAASVPTCCHNDIVASNIIGGTRLQLIDFEYARDNAPLFDLASLVGWHNLAEPLAINLLAAYTGNAAADSWQEFSAQCRRFDAIQWLWLSMRGAPSVEDRQQLNVVATRLG